MSLVGILYLTDLIEKAGIKCLMRELWIFQSSQKRL